MREEDSNQNKKWGILKYLSAEYFSEKSETNQGQRTRYSGILGQKLGYDRCPYLNFFVRRFKDEIIEVMGRGDLNTNDTNFGTKMLWNVRDASMNARRQRWFDWNEKQQRDIQICWRKRDPTPLGDNVVSLGKMVVYYLYDRCMKTRVW